MNQNDTQFQPFVALVTADAPDSETFRARLWERLRGLEISDFRLDHVTQVGQTEKRSAWVRAQRRNGRPLGESAFLLDDAMRREARVASERL